MSKKKLDTVGIASELDGASLFFTPQPHSPPPPALPAPIQPVPIRSDEIKPEVLNIPEKVNPQQTKNGISIEKPARPDMAYPNDIVETIRKTVKQVGKDALLMRLTSDEKHNLASLAYSFNEIYRGEGRKTSENEISRIALNFLLHDYQENGNSSILARVLAALNA